MEKDLEKARVEKDVVQTMLRVWEERKEEVKEVVRNEAVMISDSHLVDFDWRLHLSLASDKIATFQQPLFLLQMKRNEGEDIVLEFTKSELDGAIEKMEGIKETLVDLTV